MNIDKINKLNTLNEVESVRQQVNEACDKRAEYIKTCMKADQMSKRGFGFIKESFEAISPSLYETKEGKSILRKYVKTIKENKNLSSLHAIYESIRKANKNTDVDFFVNSLINENWEINKKSLANDVKKIGRVLAEGYIYLGKDTEKLLPKENAQLDNAVRFIAENKKTKNNLAAYSDAVKIIKESIDSNEAVLDTVLTSNLDEVIEGLINDYNQKYDGMLTNDEVAIVQELANSDKKEEVFNKYKDSCKEKVAEAKENFAKAGDEKSAKRLSVVLEQIDAKKFSIDTAANDITALIKLTNIF